ncbi:M23 family metallopeptidase [Roseovarius sp. EL26]|uniref:M23 family metallopeptidase n=1 Tax=Roseovarius sp. EL26 TaxID=2126672 RepID=UPI000EA03B75|nr:M23 family metallopeptidase [Roseovarius sp. EL26]
MKRHILWCGTLIDVLAAPVLAEAPTLVLPLDCVLGQNCYIEDYVDADPSEDQRDYTCGLKSRDGHHGTDIGLLSFEAMQEGVDVLAAAPGVVSAVRDGVADVAFTPENLDQIKGQECGNGIRIDHGDGWKTLYCHMRKGSLLVQGGDVVQAGQPVGQVGLSGLTNFPHVHFSVTKDDEEIDPFAPQQTQECGQNEDQDLWSETPSYHRAGLFTAGFSTAIPTLNDVSTGAARVAHGQPDLPLVLYGHAFYAESGDVLSLFATGPDGEIFRKAIILDDPQIHLFRAFGRKSPAGGWPVGSYHGTALLERKGQVLAVRHSVISVSD